jgi:hypothetical protein
MHSKLNVQIRKVLLGSVLGGVALFHCSGASASIVSRVEQTAGKYYTVNAVTLSDGKILEETVIHGPPTPPTGFEAERQAVSLPEPDSVAGAKSLTVPAFNWVFGCSAVSGAMIAGYYDRSGFSNIYTGPTNGGVMPLDNSSWPTWSDGETTYPNCPLIASKNGVDGRTTRGSIDDYWIQYNSSAQDPYITGGWTQHTWGDAIGDYMMTSQSAFDNSDGSTTFWNYNNSSQTLTCDVMANSSLTDGTLGRKHFYEARGYTVTDCYNQKTDNTITGGFSFAQFKAEIDAGHPVMLNLKGHTIVGVGYDDSTNKVYIHDTWDYKNHTMIWGGSYSNMALQSVSIVHIGHQLTVNVGNYKKGTVTANGLTCSKGTCTGMYSDGASVTITATAANKSYFNGWTGCDSVSGNSCTVAMTADKTVTAAFSPPPKIAVSPMSVNFGSLKADATSLPRMVKIKNSAATGGAALTLSSMTLSGTNSSEFALDTSLCPDTLDRGASCTVSVTATPSSTPFGSKTAVLAINSNDPSKQLVSVKLAAKAASPVVSVSPRSLNFGKIAVGTPSNTKTITIKNTGLSDLNITSITLGGTDFASFAQTNSCSVVPKGSSCAVNATFTPASTGVKLATISIVSNAQKNGTVTVKLAGTGK